MKKRLYNIVDKEVLKQQLQQSTVDRTTLSFYQYAHIDDPQAFRDILYEGLQAVEVFGRIYVAKEGINGQISVPTANLDALKTFLYQHDFLNGIRLNIAIDDDGKSFYKLKIKIKAKIVADGLDDTTFDATKRGKALTAREYNELVTEENAIVVDMRNHYESEVGHFKGAIRPDVDTFREALPLVEEMLDDQKDQPIVMYCTGGIRCEKASAYYLHKGFERVYMVEGGIIEYTRQCDAEGLENQFIGKNFVFDERLGERISEDVIATCHQCGTPCDEHVNCANDACHLLFIQCKACAAKYNHCCSSKCRDFIALPEEERQQKKASMIFNGTRSSKARYRLKLEGQRVLLE